MGPFGHTHVYKWHKQVLVVIQSIQESIKRLFQAQFLRPFQLCHLNRNPLILWSINDWSVLLCKAVLILILYYESFFIIVLFFLQSCDHACDSRRGKVV